MANLITLSRLLPPFARLASAYRSPPTRQVLIVPLLTPIIGVDGWEIMASSRESHSATRSVPA